MRLKTKLSLGLGFLFSVILAFGIVGMVNISLLTNESGQVLENNHNSLVYATAMLNALETESPGKENFAEMGKMLALQEGNITETGEREATELVKRNLDILKADPANPAALRNTRIALNKILEVNEAAVLRKNNAAQQSAGRAKLWMTILFTALILISFSFIFNLPSVIADPVRRLAEGIEAVADRNYSKRIMIRQKDEFGDLARSFNAMAEKLDEYEHSSLSQINFEKRRIEIIINQMHDGIIGLDDKKNILFVNEAASKLIGMDQKTITGKYAPDVARTNDLFSSLLENTGKTAELKIYANQKQSYFSKDVLHVSSEDEPVGEVIVLKNITPFYESSEAKSNFIATISHELKTPISSIKMGARLLSDGRVGLLTPDQSELLQSIVDDSNRLLKITEELLNVSQLETGNMKLKITTTSANEIVQQSIKAVQSQLTEKNITVVYSADPSIPLILADAEKSSWVLINLLTNAIKNTGDGGRITVGISVINEMVTFSVTDTGKGIDPRYLPRLFEKYFVVPGNNDKTGTGLGLAISRELVESQGGEIRVESEQGTGSTFRFTAKISTDQQVLSPVVP